MFLFRLLNLALRIIGSFFLVFLLQIQFDGKSLESYLNNFGGKFIVTKSLQKVSEDGVKLLRLSSDSKEASIKKKKVEEKTKQYFRELAGRISLPSEEEKEAKKHLHHDPSSK